MIRKTAWTKWEDDFKAHHEDGEQTGGLAMSTPMGMLPVPMTNIQFASDKIDFYVLETNFDITNGLIASVSGVDGVISIEALARYMLRIGIPKSGLFDIREVQYLVDQHIVNYFNQDQNIAIQSFVPEVQLKIMEFRDYLNKHKDFWTLLILPNGSMEVVTTHKDDQTYQQKSKLLLTTQQSVGGKLLTSKDAETLNG